MSLAWWPFSAGAVWQCEKKSAKWLRFLGCPVIDGRSQALLCCIIIYHGSLIATCQFWHSSHRCWRVVLRTLRTFLSPCWTVRYLYSSDRPRRGCYRSPADNRAIFSPPMSEYMSSELMFWVNRWETLGYKNVFRLSLVLLTSPNSTWPIMVGSFQSVKSQIWIEILKRLATLQDVGAVMFFC